MTNGQREFERDCQSAFDRLRAALIHLHASVGADPGNPQDTARRLKVNKTLTWNLSRVMGESDYVVGVQNLPGESALRTFLSAVEREGASPVEVGLVRTAAESLHEIVRYHLGDRATLDLVVDGMGSGRADHLEFSRKLAFRGNSGMWGIQTKTRLTTVFLAPNATSTDRLDIAIVRGYIGFRRLRSSVRWPLFHDRRWGSDSRLLAADRWQPLEARQDGSSDLPLLTRFSTVSPSDIAQVRSADDVDYLLVEGPIGNSGAINCLIGDFARATVSKYRSNGDTTGEFGVNIVAPAERLIFDLLVHESIDFALKPTVHGFSGIFVGGTERAASTNMIPLALSRAVVALPGTPPVVATPSVPRYPEIVSFVHERMGWNPADFRGRRLDLTYPPLGCTILQRFELPDAPGTAP